MSINPNNPKHFVNKKKKPSQYLSQFLTVSTTCMLPIYLTRFLSETHLYDNVGHGKHTDKNKDLATFHKPDNFSK